MNKEERILKLINSDKFLSFRFALPRDVTLSSAVFEGQTASDSPLDNSITIGEILKETGINDNAEKKEAILKKIAELKAEAEKL